MTDEIKKKNSVPDIPPDKFNLYENSIKCSLEANSVMNLTMLNLLTLFNVIN